MIASAGRIRQAPITKALFVVGTRLDLGSVRTPGSVGVVVGLGQMSVTFVASLAISVGFGMSPVAAIYVALALMFSSTIIVVKLLTDKREIDALHGRVAVAVLVT
jgi:predicted Kef-type K+ transport protein